MRRSQSWRRQQLPSRVSLIRNDAGRPSGRPARLGRAAVVTTAALLALAPAAAAHTPATSIGRAVAAFESVSVSYEPGAAVSDIEAGNFPHVVDSNPKVAFMSPEAASEMQGGPNAIAGEIAREARLNGTLVVLVGPQLGAWSNEMSAERLDKLVTEARGTDGTSAEAVAALVRSVQAESADSTPWALLVVIIAAVTAGSLFLLYRLSRRPTRA